MKAPSGTEVTEMKKQVRFAQTFRRLHCYDALPSINAVNGSGMGFSSEVKTCHLRPPSETKPSDDATVIRIPKSMAAAPFLQHTTLTPAQREFLLSTSNRPAHVKKIITQHYMNVLHRCIPAGCDATRNPVNGTSLYNDVDHGSFDYEENLGSENTTVSRNTRKNLLPRLPPRQTSTSASKQRKMKKHLVSPRLRSSTKRHRSWSREEEENTQDSECLDSLFLDDLN